MIQQKFTQKFTGAETYGSEQTRVQEHRAQAQAPLIIEIYVAQHCSNCAYAYEVAAEIRRQFPAVQIRIVDLGATTEAIPEAVFATPTYLLNGRVWSLGNPSPAKVQATLAPVNAG